MLSTTLGESPYKKRKTADQPVIVPCPEQGALKAASPRVHPRHLETLIFAPMDAQVISDARCPYHVPADLPPQFVQVSQAGSGSPGYFGPVGSVGAPAAARVGCVAVGLRGPTAPEVACLELGGLPAAQLQNNRHIALVSDTSQKTPGALYGPGHVTDSAMRTSRLLPRT